MTDRQATERTLKKLLASDCQSGCKNVDATMIFCGDGRLVIKCADCNVGVTLYLDYMQDADRPYTLNRQLLQNECLPKTTEAIFGTVQTCGQ